MKEARERIRKCRRRWKEGVVERVKEWRKGLFIEIWKSGQCKGVGYRNHPNRPTRRKREQGWHKCISCWEQLAQGCSRGAHAS